VETEVYVRIRRAWAMLASNSFQINRSVWMEICEASGILILAGSKLQKNERFREY
jgi:hypothetical protein